MSKVRILVDTKGEAIAMRIITPTEKILNKNGFKCKENTACKIKLKLDGWILCSRCNKWRRVDDNTLNKFSPINMYWLCDYNTDENYNECKIKQEKNNKEINDEIEQDLILENNSQLYITENEIEEEEEIEEVVEKIVEEIVEEIVKVEITQQTQIKELEQLVCQVLYKTFNNINFVKGTYLDLVMEESQKIKTLLNDEKKKNLVEKETLKRNREEFEKEKGTFKKSMEEFEKEKGTLKRDREEFEKEKRTLKRTREEFETGKGTFKRTREEFEKEKGTLKKNMEKFETISAIYKKEFNKKVDSLNNNINSFKDDRNNLNEQIKKVKIELEKCMNNI